MKYILILLILSFLSPFAFSFPSLKISQGFILNKYEVQKNDRFAWLVIHHDEQDSLRVMKWAIREFGGTGLCVYNKNRPAKRILKEIKKNQYFYYDPNRIFTDTGIHKTLAQNNRHFKRIHSFAFQILKHQIRKTFLKNLPLSTKNYLIALHNNDKKSTISVMDYYRKKGFFIFRNPKEHIKNFVIVTKRTDFEILMKNGVNVVWQYQINSSNNDGSLSVYCDKNKYNYINIESLYGHMETQKKIVSIIHDQILKKIP